MKKLFFALPLLFVFACNNAEQTENANQNITDEHAGHNHAADESQEQAVSYKTHDPVCKMVREESWTLYSVYQNDTIKFCSELCKEKFDKDPASFVSVQ